jgi:hypothetical protein
VSIKNCLHRAIPCAGTDNYGGPLVTTSELIFIAASRDEQIGLLVKKQAKSCGNIPSRLLVMLLPELIPSMENSTS